MHARSTGSVVISTASLLVALSVGCSDPEADLERAFQEFVYAKSLEVRDLGLPYPPQEDGVSAWRMELWREDTPYSPNVGLRWFVGGNDAWLFQPYLVRANLKHLGDIVVAFADSNDWDNSYDLTITMYCSDVGCRYEYDYERNAVYPSQGLEHIVEMHDRFGSSEFGEVAESEAGRAYLLEHGFAEKKHGKLERTIRFTVLSVPDTPDDYRR